MVTFRERMVTMTAPGIQRRRHRGAYLSEPSLSPPLVRAESADGFTNPILYIEEFRRIPLARSRVPAPGTTLVFRGRDGRLRAPAGGYTAGEMFLLGPRTGYQIDTAVHLFTATFEIGHSLQVDVAGRWRVRDPVATVAGRLSDLEHACTAELGERLATLAGPDAQIVRARLAAAWSDGVDVPGGVRLEALRVDVTRSDALTGEHVIQMLVTDDDESEPGEPGGADPGQLLLDLRGLARDALAEHGDAGATGQALLRFQELVHRMSDVLPDEQADDRRR
jgi:hypothetical protein